MVVTTSGLPTSNYKLAAKVVWNDHKPNGSNTISRYSTTQYIEFVHTVVLRRLGCAENRGGGHRKCLSQS